MAKITGRAVIVGAALAIFFGGMTPIAAGVAAAAVPHSGPHLLSPQLGAGAGTNIGDAAQITGSASGSLASSAADDWWVIYPSAPGATVTLKAEDTTSTSSTCGSLIVTLDASDGTESALAALDLGPSTSNSLSGSQLQSDRYFVEVTSGSCNPPLGRPTTYTLTLQSGGGGSAPSPARGSIAAGTSIGTARPPLQGKTMYSGTITSGSSDDWYALYKKPDTNPATIRVEDATVTGSTTCSSVIVTLDANDGTESALQSADLADNSAFTFSVPAEAASDPLGLYYLEVTDGGCIAGAPSYRIEPEPSTEWENPSAAPTGSVTADTSIGDASPPLQGNTSYPGTITSGTTDDWYELYKKTDADPATIRIADTTVEGATTCPSTIATLDANDGTESAIQSADLADNSAVTFAVPANAATDPSGLYYLEISNGDCVEGGDTYEIQPGPSSEWENPAQLPYESMPVGSSFAKAGGPLAGGVDYFSSIGSADSQNWNKFVDEGPGDAFATVEDPTTDQSTCQSLIVTLYNAADDAIASADLAGDSAVTFPVDTSGTYYLMADDGDCNPGPSPKTGEQVIVGPSNTVKTKAPSIPVVNCIVKGKSVVPPINQEVVKQVYLQTVGLHVSSTVQLSAFEAALVESDFNNCKNGHGTSAGVFQQINQYWGSYAQRTNVVAATNAYLKAAVNVAKAHPKYTAAQVAQGTQKSAYGSRYAAAATKAQEILNEARAKYASGS